MYACSQELRVTAVGCIEALSGLSRRVDLLSKKNGNNDIHDLQMVVFFNLFWRICSMGFLAGNNGNWISFVVDLLGFIVQQKRLILSDKNYLPSFFTSLLGSCSGGLLVPRSVEQRYVVDSFILIIISNLSQ